MGIYRKDDKAMIVRAAQCLTGSYGFAVLVMLAALSYGCLFFLESPIIAGSTFVMGSLCEVAIFMATFLMCSFEMRRRRKEVKT